MVKWRSEEWQMGGLSRRHIGSKLVELQQQNQFKFLGSHEFSFISGLPYKTFYHVRYLNILLYKWIQ
jgi:hypothetical protein